MLKFNPISIGILNSRKEYINECINSVTGQFYPNKFMELIIVKNLDKEYKIGEGYNEIVKRSKNNWILFLGDDDMIARTYLFNVNAFLNHMQNKHLDSDIVAVVTHAILIDETRKISLDIIPTGTWNRDFLIKNPFDEKLCKYVDSEMFARTNSMIDKFIIRDDTNYGYYYRQHSNNVSKNKFKEKTRILKEIEKKMKNQRIYAR